MYVSKTQGSLLLAGFMTYMVMGAFVFEILETDHHNRVKSAIFTTKEEFMDNYTDVSREEVEIFVMKVITAVQMGVEPVGHVLYEEHSTWDFANSFFFVGTMLATIGYGNLCPQTKEGQLFCVIFALFGIPFSLICLNYIGSLVSGLFQSCAEKVYGSKKKKSASYICIFVAMGLVMFLILPSLFFQWMEGWRYYEAVYFTFITLSTIGFGDYLIARKHNRTYFKGYRLIAAIWIVVGLAWITVLFELVTSVLTPDKPDASSKKKSRRED